MSIISTAKWRNLWAKRLPAPLGAALLACFSPSCFQTWAAAKELSRKFCSTQNSRFSIKPQNIFLSHETAEVFWDPQLNVSLKVWSALRLGFESLCPLGQDLYTSCSRFPALPLFHSLRHLQNPQVLAGHFNPSVSSLHENQRAYFASERELHPKGTTVEFQLGD